MTILVTRIFVLAVIAAGVLMLATGCGGGGGY
jgi:hypothetical protein